MCPPEQKLCTQHGDVESGNKYVDVVNCSHIVEIIMRGNIIGKMMPLTFNFTSYHMFLIYFI